MEMLGLALSISASFGLYGYLYGTARRRREIERELKAQLEAANRNSLELSRIAGDFTAQAQAIEDRLQSLEFRVKGGNQAF